MDKQKLIIGGVILAIIGVLLVTGNKKEEVVAPVDTVDELPSPENEVTETAPTTDAAEILAPVVPGAASGVGVLSSTGAGKTAVVPVATQSVEKIPSTTTITPNSDVSIPSEAPFIRTVYYDGGKFVPETITIVEGGTVVFENMSDKRELWVASNPHATHSRYPVKSQNDCAGSSFDQCAGMSAGKTWSFTFTEVGEWRYHNHLRAIDTGMVIVLTKKKYLEYEEDLSKLQN